MSQITAEMIERGRGNNSVESMRRRRVASELRQVREKLTTETLGISVFDSDLLRIFAQSHKGATPAIFLLALAIGATSTAWVASVKVIIWLCVVFFAALTQLSLARSYLQDTSEELDTKAWRHKFMIGEGLHGFAWAIILVLLLLSGDTTARTLALFTLLLVSALNVMISASLPTIVNVGLAPLLVAIVIFSKPFSGLDSAITIVLGLTGQLYFIVLARRLYSTTLDGLSSKAEKDTLIAELEQAKLNSDEARRRAEEASLAKSRFLATMSHELRTPLNAILGFSEVMKSELFGPHAIAAYKDYSNDIHHSGQHLLTLINEILDLSRVEAGRYELKEEAVSIAMIVEDCCHLLSLRAKSRQITLSEQIEDRLPRLWADERAVRQVALNLLSNAIKFTPQGGAVTIRVGWTGVGGQYISITDNGPGIPEEEIPVVLSSFGRGSLALKNADEGTGLGLPIVKGLVELHGGTFTLKSIVRQGTEAIVIFPPERVINALPQINEDAEEIARRRAARRRAMLAA